MLREDVDAMPAHVLVTGATGCIGSALVVALVARGDSVRALALPGEDISKLESLGVEVRRGDLAASESIRGLADRIDTVYHLAGRVTDWGKRRIFYRDIYEATKNLLEESGGKVSRFVYVSSIAAFGMGRHLRGVRETDPIRKTGHPYNDAKCDAERLVREYHDLGAMKCVIVRPSNVIGPGSVWVRDPLSRMRSMPIPLIDGGRWSASFVSVESLVDGIIRAGNMDTAAGRVYHFRDDWDVTWRRYLTDLSALIGKRPGISVPFRVAWILGSFFERVLTPLGVRPPFTRLTVSAMGQDNDVDTSLAKKELGWRTLVSYEETMRSISEWVTNGCR